MERAGLVVLGGGRDDPLGVSGLAVLPALDLEGDGGAALGGDALLLLEGLAGGARGDLDVLVETAGCNQGRIRVGVQRGQPGQRRMGAEGRRRSGRGSAYGRTRARARTGTAGSS